MPINIIFKYGRTIRATVKISTSDTLEVRAAELPMLGDDGSIELHSVLSSYIDPVKADNYDIYFAAIPYNKTDEHRGKYYISCLLRDKREPETLFCLLQLQKSHISYCSKKTELLSQNSGTLAHIVAKNNRQDAFRDIHVQSLLYGLPGEQRDGQVRLFKAVDKLPSCETFKKQQSYKMQVVEDNEFLRELYKNYPKETTSSTLSGARATAVKTPVISRSAVNTINTTEDNEFLRELYKNYPKETTSSTLSGARATAVKTPVISRSIIV